jgi:PAS domain S-box-containing protein
MVVLSAILLFLGGVILYTGSDNIRALIVLKNKMELSKNISALIHNIQRERGLSCGVIMGNGEQFERELIRQRSQTDKQISALRQRLEDINGRMTASPKIQSALSRLSTLSALRLRIDRKKVSAFDAIEQYSRINDLLLGSIADISRHSRIPEITQSLLAYMNFMYMKEYVGIERAVGAKLLSPSGRNARTLKYFTELIALEKEHEKMFLFYIDNRLKKRYYDMADPHVQHTLSHIRSMIFHKAAYENITTPQKWFKLASQKIDALNRFSINVEKEAIQLAEARMENAKNIFIFTMILTLFSAVVFFFMIRSIWKLAREEQRLRTVIDKYIISSITDLRGRIIDASQGFCDISGYTKEELVGKPHNIVRHPDMPASVFREMWAKIQSGKAWSGKVKNLKKDGGFYWVYAHIEPLRDSRNNVEAYISIRLDITESERLAEKIQEEEEKTKAAYEAMQEQALRAQMGEMINMIAHQWRQPLTAISAASTALIIKGKKSSLDAESVIHLAENINTFSKHLSTTIDDFRHFFRSDKVKVETSFAHIVEKTMAIMRNTLDAAGISIETIMENVDTFYMYENELKQVVLNVLKNAEDVLVERQVEAPRIKIVADGNRLTIEDNGGGIDPEILPKIFDPYFSTKMEKNGTGIGLYMSKMIVEEHCGGTFSAENTTHGVKFIIQLGDMCA